MKTCVHKGRIEVGGSHPRPYDIGGIAHGD